MADKPDPADALLFGDKATSKTVPQSSSAPSSDPADTFFKFDKPPADVSAQSPDTSAWGQVKGAGYQAGQGLIEGLSTTFGAPQLLQVGLDKLFGSTPPVPWNTPGNLLQQARDAGIYGTPNKLTDLITGQPQEDQTAPKGLLQEVARGVGQATGTLPLGAAMGMGPLANAGYSYGPSIFGDVMHHEVGGNPLWWALPSALVGSGAVRVGSELAAKSTATKAAAQATADAAAAKAAAKAHEAQGPAFTKGLQEQQDTAQAQAARGQTITEADAAKRHDSEIMAANTYLQAEHAGADADREAVAANLGTSKTLEEGAGKLQDKAREWLGGPYKSQMKDAEKGMYYKPDGTPLIAQDATGDVSNLKSSIEHSYISGGEADPITSLFRSRLPEQVNTKLDMIAKAQGLPPGTAPTFTFDDMRAIRSAIGDALGDPSVISNIGVKKLNEMYRGVSDDLRALVSHNAGPDGLVQFDKFNKEATRLFGVAGTVGDNIVTTTNAAKETVTPYQLANKKGLWNDSTKINQLRSEELLNQGINEVAASKLRAGGREAETAYDKLPEAKAAMYGQHGPALDAMTARRAAAEKTSADMTTAADKDLADMRTAAAKQAAASQKGAEASRQGERQERSETGISLRQELDARKDALKEARNKLNALNQPSRLGQVKIPDWVKATAGLGGAFEAGRNLGPLAAHLPSWGTDVLGATALVAGGLGLKGAHELYRNPAAIRNLLLSGASTANAPPEKQTP